ncbi:hypothetical protein FH972_019826 [Carpinus fangiana]|uniref:Uncharacterized protein n=1 Tax=Carpinus fangiana TaxID=176857 RepID=A0A5N6RRE6_9ROSI|nr:hypothetical protein FH972_019826 [Carpinus fangiana]
MPASMTAPMPNHMRSHQLSVFFIPFWLRALTSTSSVWSKRPVGTRRRCQCGPHEGCLKEEAIGFFEEGGGCAAE